MESLNQGELQKFMSSSIGKNNVLYNFLRSRDLKKKRIIVNKISEETGKIVAQRVVLLEKTRRGRDNMGGRSRFTAIFIQNIKCRCHSSSK